MRAWSTSLYAIPIEVNINLTLTILKNMIGFSALSNPQMNRIWCLSSSPKCPGVKVPGISTRGADYPPTKISVREVRFDQRHTQISRIRPKITSNGPVPLKPHIILFGSSVLDGHADGWDFKLNTLLSRQWQYLVIECLWWESSIILVEGTSSRNCVELTDNF